MNTLAHRDSPNFANVYGMLSADQDTTFLLHYGLSLEDSLRGISPIGSPAALINRRGGRFGGCAMELQNATEYCTNGDFNQGNLTGFSPINGAVLSIALEQIPTTDWPNQFGLTMKATTTADSPDANYNHNYGVQSLWGVGAAAANRTFTGGAWVMGDPGEQAVILIQSTDWTAGNNGSRAITLTGEPQYISVTKTFSSTATNASVHVRLSFNRQGSGQVLRWSDITLKELQYPTDYGTISGDPLAYPINEVIPNRESWTMSGWFRPLKATGYSIVFSIGRYTSPATEDYLWFGWGSGTDEIRFSSTRGNVGTVSGAAGLHPRNGSFYHLAVTFDWPSRKYRIYVDGELKLTLDCAVFGSAPTYLNSAAQEFNEKLFIGYNIRSADYVGFAAEEVRFDRRVVTPDEIKTWAQAKAPFHPRGIHKVLI